MKKENIFKKYIMSFSLSERKRRKFNSYKEIIESLRSMDADHLMFEYIEVKVKYGHKKGVLIVFLISTCLILMNVWDRFFTFIGLSLQYATTAGTDSIEIAKISFFISVITALFITSLILFFLFTFIKDLVSLKKELMIIEEVKSTVHCKND